MPDPYSFHHRQALIEVSGQQSFNLVDRPDLDHVLESGIAPLIQFGPVKRHKQPDDFAIRSNRALSGFLLPLRQRTSRCVEHLERPDNTLPVPRLDPGGCFLIDIAKRSIQCLRPFCLHPVPPSVPNSGRNIRNCGEPVFQCTEIEPCTTGYDRHLTRAQRRRYLGGCRIEPLSHGIRLSSVDRPIEPVGNHCLIGHAWPCRKDLQVTIKLHGIGIDDNAIEGTGKLEGNRRLARRRRSCNKDHDAPVFRRVRRRLFVTLCHCHIPQQAYEERTLKFVMNQFVVTLISTDPAHTLSHYTVNGIAAGLPATPTLHWLASDIACDIILDGFSGSLEDLRGLAKTFSTDQPFDVAVQINGNRRKRVLIADMDSTIIDQECIDEVAAAFGKKDEVAAITERTMRGELEFGEALKHRVSFLKGLHSDALAAVFEAQITIRPGATTLVRTMQRHGAYTALVSGGFTYFTQRVAELVGFEENRANELLFDGDVLNGRVGDPVLARESKLQALNEFTQRFDITPADVLAVGDGANDLDMIEAAGLGVGFHAKPLVTSSADVSISHSDLTALLYIQGYRLDEFVS